MNPLAVLGAGSTFAPQGGAAGPSSADGTLTGGNVVFSSPFAVGSGASATASPATTSGIGSSSGGVPVLLIAGAAAVVLVLLLARR